MDIDAKLQGLKMLLVSEIGDIESVIQSMGLDGMDKITLIIRDPANPNMFIVLSNDNQAEAAGLLDC